MLFKINKSNKTNNSIVPDTTDREAVSLEVDVHVAVPTVEEQAPAVGGIVLRTAPVVAVRAAVAQ